jgi:predicted ATP-binding protein involved in virulence
VLIDEIDLHLHPAWQRLVASKLTETFPSCQFVVSTHSPQVFGEVDAESLMTMLEPVGDEHE